MIRRYAVIDENGVKVNSIFADLDVNPDFWPGYGAALVDEGEQSAKPNDFAVLPITPDAAMAVGDSIDVKSGKVTKADQVKSDLAVIADAQSIDAQVKP